MKVLCRKFKQRDYDISMKKINLGEKPGAPTNLPMLIYLITRLTNNVIYQACLKECMR
jgi:hypothetical protein